MPLPCGSTTVGFKKAVPPASAEFNPSGNAKRERLRCCQTQPSWTCVAHAGFWRLWSKAPSTRPGISRHWTGEHCEVRQAFPPAKASTREALGAKNRHRFWASRCSTVLLCGATNAAEPRLCDRRLCKPDTRQPGPLTRDRRACLLRAFACERVRRFAWVCAWERDGRSWSGEAAAARPPAPAAVGCAAHA